MVDGDTLNHYLADGVAPDVAGLKLIVAAPDLSGDTLTVNR